MSSRIVVFGATGFTGELVARALVASGERPVLAGRNRERLSTLAAQLGSLETAVADVERPESVRALVEQGDVLVTTVGPYLRYGAPALSAAVEAGAHYLDSTGEGPFIRTVFDEYGPRAEQAGCGLLTAFGYDFVPGNLAGGLALARAEAAGRPATRLEVFYVAGTLGASGGTLASGPGVMLGEGFAFRRGRLVRERPGARVRAVRWRGRDYGGLSVSGTEQLALPRLKPELTDVDVYLASPGTSVWQLQALSAGLASLRAVEPVRRGVEVAWAMAAPGSTGGPSEEVRRRNRCGVVAHAFDAGGGQVATVGLEGPDPYDLTASLLAWGAAPRVARGSLLASGALGPVDAFGLDELEAGAREAGLVPV